MRSKLSGSRLVLSQPCAEEMAQGWGTRGLWLGREGMGGR
jgi:hypothetical protein